MATPEKISEMLDSNPSILRLLVDSESLSEARRKLNDYLNTCEKEVLSSSCPLHPLEKKNTRDCINVFKNIIAENNEKKTSHSCLNTLWKLAADHWRQGDWHGISDAFLVEMKHLFKGVIGLSGIYSKSGICKREVPAFMHMEGRDAAVMRSVALNEKAEQYNSYINKNDYKTGLEPMLIDRRAENKKAIIDLLGGTEEDWYDYRWQYKMCFRDTERIAAIIELTEEEKNCIDETCANRIPFGITPHYLSLMDKRQTVKMNDRAIRSHVIPSRNYTNKMLKVGIEHKDSLDYMHESDTSPEDLITRRYPMIAILKPYSWCPQICIYCQRNWELSDDGSQQAAFSKNKVDKALLWFSSNPGISEVLITGGDPLALCNEDVEYILFKLSEMEHIKRIRIGTRTLVTMPMRFDSGLLNILKEYHNPPKRCISIITHVQHSYEISEDMAQAAKSIKSLGIDIYNQQVFTIQNCRRFETCFLRESLKSVGINPYYLFNLKDKEETGDFKVPIARILQEQKEEARLMPGIVRTDRTVFNIPTLGKNNLSSCQDHDVIMILDDGSRIYEFYPWERYMAPVNTYLYKDEPIYSFLQKMERLGESVEDYKTIWYYF